MEIKILGTGCPNCKRLERVTLETVTEMGIQPKVTKVTDINGIMAYDILSTPGLVIDEQLVSSGRIPSKAEISSWLTNALAAEEA